MDALQIRYYGKLIETRRELRPNEKAEIIEYLCPCVPPGDVAFMEQYATTYYLIRLLQETWQYNNRKT
ncbi:hypothetical protein GCM10028803_61800 [Larkinella knui]|uniref:Uncharacterized protein n=1 Tax=Larkinella knui TaxID=2025310 RepID=A0A3P1CB05_9BACT|nr:hypothetical protein [Larkinella knui]RRB10511.1 hypothetical protein EHT87_30295 [Larkinella knui]